jgi:hypothetical protein
LYLYKYANFKVSLFLLFKSKITASTFSAPNRCTTARGVRVTAPKPATTPCFSSVQFRVDKHTQTHVMITCCRATGPNGLKKRTDNSLAVTVVTAIVMVIVTLAVPITVTVSVTMAIIK